MSEDKKRGKKKKKKRTKESPPSVGPAFKGREEKELSPEISTLLSPEDPQQNQVQCLKTRSNSKKNSDQDPGSRQRTKKRQKSLQNMQKTNDETTTAATITAEAPPHETLDPWVHAEESLRWEGVLQDPEEEARRLEQYRANRRQRYIAHREALQQSQQALKGTFP